MNVPRAFKVTVGAAAILGLIAIASLPTERIVFELEAPQDASSRVSFWGTSTVSQTIRAPLNDVARLDIRVDTPAREEAYPLIIHLKSSASDRKDLRTLFVTRREIPPEGNTLTLRFFPPFTETDAKELAVVLDAPKAAEGEFSVFREVDDSKYPEGQLLVGNKNQPGNIALALSARKPAVRHALNDVAEALRRSAPSAEDLSRREPFQRSAPSAEDLSRREPFQVDALTGIAARQARPVMGALIAAAGILSLPLIPAVGRWLQNTPRRVTRGELLLFACLAILSLALHTPYIRSYPVVNDEGSYLLDITQIRDGTWPFRDVLTKGPLSLLVMSPVVLLSPHPSLFAVRWLMALLSAGGVVLIGLLARALWGRLEGTVAASLYAVTPAVIAQSTQVFLQPTELLFVSLAFLTVACPTPDRGARSHPRDGVPAPSPSFLGGRKRHLLAGVLLALAYLSRASAVAYLPILALLPLTARGFPLRQRLSHGARAAAGFFLFLLLIAALAMPFLGYQKTAVFFNLEAFLIGQARADIGQARATFDVAAAPPREIVENVIHAGRAALSGAYPLLLLWFLLTVTLLLRALRLHRFLLAATAGAAILAAWSPFRHAIPSAGTPLAGWARLGAAAALAVFGIESAVRLPWHQRAVARDLLLFGGTWLSLVALYLSFGRFRQHYHPEFLWVYVLASAAFLSSVLRHPLFAPRATLRDAPRDVLRRVRSWRQGGVALASVPLLTVFWLVLAHPITRATPHAGTIPVETAEAAARVIRYHSAPGEPILTAQAILPFLAERPVLFAASHPGWYLEERAGTISTPMRQLYFPDRDVIRRSVLERPVRLVVLDRRTREVYVDPDPELQRILEASFERVQSFEVMSEQPIELWKRRAQEVSQ